jgi:hypothetical protein
MTTWFCPYTSVVYVDNQRWTMTAIINKHGQQ